MKQIRSWLCIVFLRIGFLRIGFLRIGFLCIGFLALLVPQTSFAGKDNGISTHFVDPMVAVTPIAQSRFHLDLGTGSYSQSVNNATASHLSTAFALGYEYGGGIFGFNFRLPFGLANSTPTIGDKISTFMLGDIGMRFRWRVLSMHKTKSYLSFGFELTLPSNLLNTLGGKRRDIFFRRQKDPLYRAGTTNLLGTSPNDFNMLPIRYLGIAPQLAFAQNIGKLSFGAHFMGTIFIASDLANLYENPHVEVILSYDVYAGYDFTNNGLFEAIFEINGNSFVTTTATDLAQVDGGTSLGLTLGARTRFKKRFEASLGFQYNLPISGDQPNRIKRGYDLSTFYRHDWSILFRFAIRL